MSNTEKTKIMVFEKGGRRRKKKKEWIWDEQVLKEVKKMKYLGFTMQKNGKWRGIYKIG